MAGPDPGVYENVLTSVSAVSAKSAWAAGFARLLSIEDEFARTWVSVDDSECRGGEELQWQIHWNDEIPPILKISIDEEIGPQVPPG